MNTAFLSSLLSERSVRRPQSTKTGDSETANSYISAASAKKKNNPKHLTGTGKRKPRSAGLVL